MANEQLEATCRRLTADMLMHQEAGNYWHLDPGKLESTLDAFGLHITPSKPSEYRLKSTPLVYAPGFIAAMRNDYNLGGESQWKAIEIVSSGWGLPVNIVRIVLDSKSIQHQRIENDDLVITIPDADEAPQTCSG